MASLVASGVSYGVQWNTRWELLRELISWWKVLLSWNNLGVWFGSKMMENLQSWNVYVRCLGKCAKRDWCKLLCLGEVSVEEVLVSKGDLAWHTDEAERDLKWSTQSSIVGETSCGSKVWLQSLTKTQFGLLSKANSRGYHDWLINMIHITRRQENVTNAGRLRNVCRIYDKIG